MTFERKLATAKCLDNTRRQIRAMEAYTPISATQPANIGTKIRANTKLSELLETPKALSTTK